MPGPDQPKAPPDGLSAFSAKAVQRRSGRLQGPPTTESIVYSTSGGRMMPRSEASQTVMLETLVRVLEAASALSCSHLTLTCASDFAATCIREPGTKLQLATQETLLSRVHEIVREITSHNPDGVPPNVLTVDTAQISVATRDALQEADHAYQELAAVEHDAGTDVQVTSDGESTLITAIAGPHISCKGGTAPAAWAVALIEDDGGFETVTILQVERAVGVTSPCEAHARAAACAVKHKTTAKANVFVGDHTVPRMADHTYKTSSVNMKQVMGYLLASVKTADPHDEGLIRFTHMTRKDQNIRTFRVAQQAAQRMLRDNDRGGALQLGDRVPAARST